MEENWYQNSSTGKQYLEISVDELEDVLYRDGVNAQEKEGCEVSQLFRM